MAFVCLTYHRIGAERASQADPYALTAERFESQMRWLAEHGYVGVTVQQALNTRQQADAPARRLVALAFDDGYRDFHDQGWPVLRDLGFRATLFVVAGKVGGSADWAGGSSAPLLDWDELGQLAEAGLELGGHGLEHRPLDHLPPARLARVLAEQQALFRRRLGWSPAGLAYPYGRWSAAVAAAVRQAGFDYAATARGGRNHGGTPPFKLRRTLITASVGGRLARLRFALLVRSGYAQLAELRMDLRRLP